MKATLTSIQQLTPDTSKLVFSTIEPLNFIPGQFIMLDVLLRNEGSFTILDGKNALQRRSFSISSSPTLSPFCFELTVKKEQEGFVSDFLTSHVKVGEEFSISGPYGKFTLSDTMSHVIMLGAGSGIAPLRSMIHYIIDKDLPTEVDLFYSNKTREDIAHEAELLRLSKTHDSIHVHFTLTRESEKHWRGLIGRINFTMISKVITPASYFYLCGSPQMVKDLRLQLLSGGIEEKRVKMEMW